MTFIGTILPGGNKSEFPKIRRQLRKRNIVWRERILQNESIIFYFKKTELNKLPVDIENQGNHTYKEYLPVDNSSGHSIDNMDRILKMEHWANGIDVEGK